MMNVRELLNQFDLFLKLPDVIMEIEVEGDYDSYTTYRDDESIHTYYVFEDNQHHIEISETNYNCMLEYFTFPFPEAPAYGFRYDHFGAVVSET